MPITPAHAAAAWPVRRWLASLPLSALVIGAMSPDYEYFLTLAPITREAHTFAGLALFCVPVSLVAWLVFRRVVRPALVDLLPAGLAAALGPASTSWPLALVAVTIGAVSHIFWDGFTHYSDWAVTSWPVLRTRPIPALPLPWYKLLQHGSSIGGTIAIGAWIASWVQAQPVGARVFAPGQRARALRAIAGIALVSVLSGFADSLLGSRHRWSPELARFAVGAMLGCIVATLVFALVYRRAPLKHVAA
jgi:hypothetical protein